MTQKRDYEKPTMKVVPVKKSQMLCASPGSGDATNTTTPWGDGGTDNDDLYF